MPSDKVKTSGGPAPSEPGREQASLAGDLPTTLARVEREMIVMALRASRGNKARAARALGISERLMGLRVNKYALDPKAFRAKG